MMKNYFITLITIFCSHFLFAQNVNIPDANFKQYLVSKFDTNLDGEIQQSEALLVTSISCASKNISSLEGIKSFPNLTSLYCPSNNIINLDLTGLNKLKKLDCFYNNNMQTLNLQGLISLETLNCYYNRLPSLNLQGLINLKNIDCYGNYFTSLDVSGFTKLVTLNCYSGFLTSLKFDNAISLTNISCYNNKLASLDVRSLTNLQSLNCSTNILTDLKVNGLKNLVHLEFARNNLTTINLQGLTKLLNLDCSYNQFTKIDVTGLSALGAILCFNNKLNSIIFQGEYPVLNNLFCNNNEFTELDLNNLPLLQTLEAYNNPNLSNLFIKNGMNQTQFLKLGNTNLKYVCCDDSEYDYVQNLINQLGFQNQCAVNTYCSFIPGGSYNTIQGATKYDFNNNGCDTNDLSFFPVKYTLTNGTNSGIFAGSTNGEYKTYVNEGTYTIIPKFENPDYFIATPASKQFVFADSNNNIQTQDFCISSNGTKNDLEVKIIPVNSVRPGFETTFTLIYKNKGNTVLNGDVNFIYDATKSQFISTNVSPNTQTSGNLLWNFSNLKPFESKIINITLKTNPPTSVNIGDQLTYKSIINPLSGDLTPIDNTFQLNQTVVGSFDPNDKVCLEGSTISPNLVGQYITYKIRFENTGTANAEQVVVKDIINTSMFDVASFLPVIASHPYQTRITENVVEFIFENINLPFDDANNDGYVVFKIKTLPSLTVGSVIKNKADIFFDYNLPIITNEFSSVFQTLGTENLKLEKEINVYPNPVKDFVNIESKLKISSIDILDFSGRILQKLISPESKINVAMYKKGIYLLKINTEKGFSVKKIIKE